MALKNKRVLLGHDTGMGKSYMCAIVIRALVNAQYTSKHLVVMVHDSIIQLPRDIANIAKVSVGVSDATSFSANHFIEMVRDNTVVCVTYDALQVPIIANTLFQCASLFKSLTIDEAHHAANWDSSDIAFTLRALAQYFDFVIGLTATPMTVKSRQFYQLMNLIDSRLSYRKNETSTGKYEERYLPVNRADYQIKGEYVPELVTVTPHIFQLGKQHGVVFEKLKGPGAENQVQALVKVLKQKLSEGKKSIVYIEHHEVREWVEEHLKAEGIPYVAINGKVTKREVREERQRQFNDGEVGVMLTSISESLNLAADAVIFYEFNVRMKQVIGRAHRGLEGKKLEIIVIITKDTDEVDFFLDKVLSRAEVAQALLRKDYSEILKIGNELKRISLED